VKAKVITLLDMPASVDAAARCIETGAKYGIFVEMHEAYTPNSCQRYFDQEELTATAFDDDWSRKANAMACFSSHHSLWREIVDQGESMLILEHDAIFVSMLPILPEMVQLFGIINLARPSFGKYKEPRSAYAGKLISRKTYVGGAHGYIVTPAGARCLLENAKQHAKPADKMLDPKAGLKIGEIYPWCIEAHDSFSTVQKEKGCKAKHKFSADYRLLDL